MNSSLDRIVQKLRIRVVAPPLRQLTAFWSWWSSELVVLLPEQLKELIARHRQRSTITIDGAEFVVSQNGQSGATIVGRYPLNASDDAAPLHNQAGEVILCLPPELVLISSMTFPLATEENLRGVLGFEMDRQTPFTLDQVYFGYHITKRSSATRSITLDLVVAPKERVDQLLTSLSCSGIRPDVVSTRGPDSEAHLPLNLLPKAAHPNRRMLSFRLNTTLAAICLALLATALVLPLLLKQQQIRELEPQLKIAIADAKDGVELRQEVERLTTGSEFLVQKKRRTVPVLSLIDELTRILPDNTWLTEMSIHASEIQIQGQSVTAAALIELLESSPMLQNARFRSPVVQVPRTNMERFHISVELEVEESS